MRRFALLLVLAACGADPVPPPACPNDLPAACPSPAPAYADVAPVIQAKCLACHAPGGQAASTPLDSHAAITARKRTVLSEVYGCRMPPPGAPALSAAERAELLAWFVCGAP